MLKIESPKSLTRKRSHDQKYEGNPVRLTKYKRSRVFFSVAREEIRIMLCIVRSASSRQGSELVSSNVCKVEHPSQLSGRQGWIRWQPSRWADREVMGDGSRAGKRSCSTSRSTLVRARTLVHLPAFLSKRVTHHFSFSARTVRSTYGISNMEFLPCRGRDLKKL